MSLDNTPEIINDGQASPDGAVAPQGNEEPTQDTPAPSQDGDTPAEETPKQEPPKKKFSKRERLEFTRDKIESQLAELDDEEDDDKPLTRGDLKRMKQQDVKDSAIELASDIEDELERDAVIDILENRLVPSDDPNADLKSALTMANATKAMQQLEEMARKGRPKSHASTPGGPGNAPDHFEPTEQERVFMSPPYNLSQEDIIKARNQASQNG